MHLRQWRHLYGVVGDECGLDERAFAELSEELVDEFSLSHCLVDVHSLFFAEGAYLLLGLSVAVESCLFLYGIEDWQSAVGGFEGYDVAVDFSLRLSVHGYADGLKQVLGERHHPVVVFILHVELHACELGVVVSVHSLVAEVLSYLVHTFESTHDESFQI